MSLQGALRNRLRAALTARDAIQDPRRRPWREAAGKSSKGWRSVCNICGWHGDGFASGFHSEGALCPCCGSIARDRFLHWCWTRRTDYDAAARVLETSPRLDHRYRTAMGRLVTYTSSDYDESAHKASIKLDIQSIDLPSGSVDVVLTPHVLEHVPDTERSLAELHRILAPGGHLFLEIPMPQGVTAPPTTVEYHGDNTLVYWRFGWDLRVKLEAAGFRTEALVTSDLIARVAAGKLDSGYGGDDCDEVDLLSHVTADELTAVADEREARRYGFLPDFMFICWHGIKDADDQHAPV